MSNHYHILIETPDANLPQIMKHLNGSYTTYFNVKRKRYGHLFQGRYKAFLAFKDDYAMELQVDRELKKVMMGVRGLIP